MQKVAKKEDKESRVSVNLDKINKRVFARFVECFVSFGLGYCFGITASRVILDGIKMNYSLSHYSKMGFFISSCGLYHFMEFMWKCQFHHMDLTWHDFLIDQSYT